MVSDSESSDSDIEHYLGKKRKREIENFGADSDTENVPVFYLQSIT